MGIRTQNTFVTKNKFWLNELYNLAITAQIDLQQIGRLMWKSCDFKIFFEAKMNTELLAEIETHTTLNLLGPIHRDHNYDSKTQSWWLKAKLGSIRLQSKDNPEAICCMCGEHNENMLHMFTCVQYPQCCITDIIETLPELPVRWDWVFHFDRSSDIRAKTSRWIHSRWRTRENTILRARGHDPDGAGEHVGIPDLDQGTETGVIQRDPVNNAQAVLPRRGPARKCKMSQLYMDCFN